MAGDALAPALAAVARARAMLGVRFRFQGRDASGLDCVGLVALAYHLPNVPDEYDLRATNVTQLVGRIDTLLARTTGALCASDVLLLRAGPAQLHLGLWSGCGLIHAHAGLRRVVETPGPIIWPIEGQWRMDPKQIGEPR